MFAKYPTFGVKPSLKNKMVNEEPVDVIMPGIVVPHNSWISVELVVSPSKQKKTPFKSRNKDPMMENSVSLSYLKTERLNIYV